jgi:predicted oxidoreductase
MDADVVVVGAGLAGLVATHELTSRGKRVAVVDQENAANLGGQAFWSFGGLFLVDSAQQRRLGVTDSVELAWSDWQGSAQFDRLADEDWWAVRWAGHLHSRALGRDGQPIDGLYAAGEVAGFGGGGAHGYNALEGTFLGGCLFSGRTAGRDLTHRL